MKLTKGLIVLVAFGFGVACGKREAANMDARSGATPLAVARVAPSNLELTVNGEVKQEYRLGTTDLNGLATTRIRTREVARDGEYLGAYAYIGIPLIHILEGVAPEKNSADFNRPLDMIVSVTSSDGKKAYFSYNEICMTDDAFPITLAFHREPVVPSKDAENYAGNLFKEALNGLRLICPADYDVGRYLDDVKTISLHTAAVNFPGLPVQQQGGQCSSDFLVRCKGENCNKASLKDLETTTVHNWVRVGHGRGFKGISTASGYRLTSFLKKNFPDDTEDSFYLFIGCDGYRSLFSGTEIFKTAAGSDSLIITEMDGILPRGGLMLGPVRDFFIDRDVWGLSHIVQLNLTKS